MVASGEDVDFDSALTQTATLRILDEGGEQRQWTLKLAAAGFERIESGSRRYRISLRDPLWFLRFTRGVRKFRNRSAQDIVSMILTEGGVSAAWSLTRATQKRNYCVQY